MPYYDIVEGSSNNVQFQLLDNGVPIDLSSLTVTLLLEDRTGTVVSSPGTVTVTDAANGKVQLTPTSTSVFVASNGPYYARWKLVDVFNKVAFVPTSTRDVWAIVGN